MYKERPEQIWIASIARKIVLVAGSILVFLLTTQQVHAEELELYRRQLKLPGDPPEGQQILPVESAKS
ncbi:MAG: hypothetical protein KDD70_14790, partial [Bdellovibrionales bacterium]|nr:hypothetical protein [Bdellovibrionales bacterium]